MKTIIPQYRNDGFQSFSRQLRNMQDKMEKNIMPLIKSLFTVRYSQIADVVNRKVNRDAMIEVTIKDNRRVTTKAKIHLSKVGNDGQKLN